MRPHHALRLYRTWARIFDRTATTCNRGWISPERSIDRINGHDQLLDAAFKATPAEMRFDSCNRCRRTWLTPIDRPTATWYGPCRACGWHDVETERHVLAMELVPAPLPPKERGERASRASPSRPIAKCLSATSAGRR